jgi:hypothetical protein
MMKTLRRYLVPVRAALVCPSEKQRQIGLFVLGVVLLTAGILSNASAQYEAQATYNDDRVAESVDVILTYINGTFGALVMVSAGIGAILSSAFGQYRAALGLLVVAVGSFILRSLVSTWFNDANLQANTFGA